MSELAKHYYTRDGCRAGPADICGYREQADRIDDYQAQHTPESVIRFYSDQFRPDGYPDGCQVCGRATWWEHRELPNGQRQSRCTECRDSVVWPK
jgi:hypothetical protein